MIRFGVVGTSWITEEFIRCATLTDDFCLSAVYSRTEEKAQAFADKHGAKHVFTDLTTMASSPEFDAVYIASPNSHHAKQAILFLSHKKHVLCEKPIASNSKELEAMIECATANGALLMEAMKSTFLPNMQSVRENLPKLGPVRRFFSNYCQYSSRYDTFKAGKPINTFDPAFSNGSIMDIGVYCIYPVIYLFGPPESVSANATMLSSGIDGCGSITLHYKDMEAIISHSKIANSLIPSEIQGENGNILIDKISTPEDVKIIYRDGSTEDITRPQKPDLMFYEAREFIQLIKTGQLQSSTNTFTLNRQVMQVMDEARKQIGLVFPAD